jgi:hypothetical protein
LCKIKKLLHIKGNNYQSEETTQRTGEESLGANSMDKG